MLRCDRRSAGLFSLETPNWLWACLFGLVRSCFSSTHAHRLRIEAFRLSERQPFGHDLHRLGVIIYQDELPVVPSRRLAQRARPWTHPQNGPHLTGQGLFFVDKIKIGAKRGAFLHRFQKPNPFSGQVVPVV